MKITGVAWQGFALPFRRPYVTSQGTATVRHGLLLFLLDDSGLAGVGEASPVGAGSLAEIKQLAAALASLAPRLLGTNLGALTEAPLPPSLNIVLRFGLETALLDFTGKSQGRSVAELLGGVLGPLPVNALIAAETPREAATEAAEAVAQGFTSLKLKVAQGSPEQDEALVSAVRQAVGPEVKLRIDPNQGWSVPQAIESLRRLAKYDLEYVEQPVAAADLAGMAEVRRNTAVPVAADEALGSLDDLERLLETNAADLLVVKAARLGGLRQALEVMRRGIEAGKPSVVTTSLESGVGIAACAHLAATLPSHPFAHGLATGPLLKEELLAVPLTLRQGTLSMPQGPGLGVAVDMSALDRYDIGINGSTGSWR